MRKTFAAFDDLLIERLFQPTSALIAGMTNLGHGAAICFCLDVASVAWIASRVDALSNIGTSPAGSFAFLDLTLLLLGLAALFSLRLLFRNNKSRYGNPLRPAMQPHRAIVLLMLATSLLQARAASLAGVADTVMLVFAAFALYLGACADLPPTRRRWIAFAPAG